MALSSGDCLLRWTATSLSRPFDIREGPVERHYLAIYSPPPAARADSRRAPCCRCSARRETARPMQAEARRCSEAATSRRMQSHRRISGNRGNVTEPFEPEQERRRTIWMLIRADRFLKNRAAENADWKQSVGHRSGIASVVVKRKSGITRVPLGLAGTYSVFLWTFTTSFRWERSLWLFLAKSTLPSCSSTRFRAALQLLC